MGWIEVKKLSGKEITKLLYENGMIMTWYRHNPEGWRLKSGGWSPYYIDLRPLPSYPDILRKVGHVMGSMIKEEAPKIDSIVGIASTGVPIAAAISVLEDIPACYTRKLDDRIKTVADFDEMIKIHGQHEQIEGRMHDGDNMGLVDDVVTGFDSKLLANEQVQHVAKEKNITVNSNNVMVLINREQGAEKRAKELGFNLFSLVKMKKEGLGWLEESFSEIEKEVIPDYIENDGKYQDINMREKLIRIAKEARQKSQC